MGGEDRAIFVHDFRAKIGLLALALALLAPLPGLAQDRAQPGAITDSLPVQGPVRSPVLTVDIERLFAESAYGSRAAAELRAASERLAAENAEIVAELQRIERDLTERRPDMDPAAFRAEAEAFDARVQSIRAERDARERELQSSLTAAREEFLGAVTPVLGELMLASGAAVLLDRRNVFLGVGLVDITDEAIARIDAALGDGEGADPIPLPDDVQTAPDPAPEPEPEPLADPIDISPGTD